MKTFDNTFIEELRFNQDGLIPAIAQDWLDGAVLMMAWMNKESIEKTLTTGEVHYWSRTRKELWHKGSTSGHIQKLKSIGFDCDADTLLLTIKQEGNIACHTGKRSCFYRQVYKDGKNKASVSPPKTDSCSELSQVIKQRHMIEEPGSYTNKLFKGGDNMILKKIGEESAEFVMACKDEEPKDIANEAADLIFHLQVAITSHGVDWRDVLEILVNRRGAPRRN